MRYDLIVAVICAFWIATEGTFLTRFFFQRTIYFRESLGCYIGNSSKYAIIVHGWRETCDVDWARNLTSNLERYREGCVICMDYRFYAKTLDYFKLVRHMNEISAVLKDKLVQMEERGYDPSNGYLFGFSLGARIALKGGILYGNQKIGEIDLCDMAGPGFDKSPQPNPRDAALNVQCIYTSRDKGTRYRQCHQNWNMGYCGERQEAAGNPPLGSHGLCPRFYNSAFEHNFYAEITPKQCSKSRTKVPIPTNFKMGYMERRKFKTWGDFYASTTKNYPYTATNEFKIKAITVLPSFGNSIIMYIKGQKYVIQNFYYLRFI